MKKASRNPKGPFFLHCCLPLTAGAREVQPPDVDRREQSRRGGGRVPRKQAARAERKRKALLGPIMGSKGYRVTDGNFPKKRTPLHPDHVSSQARKNGFGVRWLRNMR